MKQDLGLRLYECKDNKGRTARDCARLLGRTDCEQLLSDLQVGVVLLDMCNGYGDKQFDTNHWKQKWKALGISIQTLQLTPSQTSELEKYLHKSVENAHIEMAQWLVKEWNVNPDCRIEMAQWLGRQESPLGLLGRVVLNNPNFKLEDHKKSQSHVRTGDKPDKHYKDELDEEGKDDDSHQRSRADHRLARGIYNEMIVGQGIGSEDKWLYGFEIQGWDGLGCLGDAARKAYKACLSRERGPGLHCPVGYHLERVLEYHIAILEPSPAQVALERIAEWLLAVLPEDRPLPPLQHFVLYRHCGLLVWFEKHGLVDLDAQGAPKLLKYVGSLAQPYTSDDMCTKQVLLILSVVHGDFQTMEFLITKKGADPCLKSKGYNLLHIAAKHKELEAAVWLVINDLVPITDVTSTGEDVAAIAMGQGFLLLGKFLMDQGSQGMPDVNGHDVVWHAMASGVEDVMEWAQQQTKAREQHTLLPTFLLDLEILTKLISNNKFDESLQHIEHTNCLDHKNWRL